MKELIKIMKDDSLGQAVSARELYGFLEGKERFSKWFDRMIEYGFIRDVDYTPYQMVHPSNHQEIHDHALTLDTAKEIAMIQKSEKGREARRYFIQRERVAKSLYNDLGIQVDNAIGSITLSTRSISTTTGIDHNDLIRLIKRCLDEYTEMFNDKRHPKQGHLKKGKFLIENIWELKIHGNSGVPRYDYIITREGFNYLVERHGFLTLTGFLPLYSRQFEILAHHQHVKRLNKR